MHTGLADLDAGDAQGDLLHSPTQLLVVEELSLRPCLVGRFFSVNPCKIPAQPSPARYSEKHLTAHLAARSVGV
jgi:hypothetical protein